MQPISAAPARSAHLAPFDPRPFAVSPLYSQLCRVVAADPALLELASHTRAGQQPEFALFGAVHLLLLDGAEHELTGFYPSVVGTDARRPDGVGPAFTDFCATFREQLVGIVSTRMVQTNQVRRAVGLRAALAAIAPHVDGPVELIEVGSSAGLLLRFDRYGYRVGDSTYGDPHSAVQLSTELRGAGPLPDLDALPELASVTGIDLHPVDATDPDSRAWLRALVWPEDDEQRDLLTAALDLVATDPPATRSGDAIEVLSDLARPFPDGRHRIVFHCATRMHVPQERLAAFDSAIDAVGHNGPLWRVAIEGPPEPDPRADGATPGAALQIDDPDGRSHLLAVVNGHLRWIEPVDNALTATRG